MGFGRQTRTQYALAIHERTPFKSSTGSFYGKWVNADMFEQNGQGRLSDEIRNTMRELLKDRDLYVVYSYDTPIGYAWDRTMHVPADKYSATTSSHQYVTMHADQIVYAETNTNYGFTSAPTY